MKKFLVAVPMAALFLASCGGGNENHALEEVLEDKEDFDAAAHSFADGNAKNGEQYFFGVLAEVIEADYQFQKVEALDDNDAPLEEINATLDSCLNVIKGGRKALNLYKDKDWPKRAEFHDLTLEWFDEVEGLVKNHLRALAEPMSRPDDTWTDEELDAYSDYSDAFDEYLDLDERWVNFQYEYASANGFTLSEEGIDVSDMVEEDMALAE